ncbi:hypothetical protein TI10_10265 [Photorhabdus luminescens subsp. luminescens]|uniref:CdiI immunity protein domain-containing protein n=1 Tax=Photorhabdus luminescens TaxID=29488 RepID=A0A1G5R6T4_PHOLU|nr:contact-dependent growth inhibition system immunity protein [Photorhabdus luminescens]KMW73432.1 hypothetical protein TI10_10265 [Photorhabdus luminescens subsp. luminescens]SCZ69039.1 hypothetical protein SAMN02982990_03116 [Photorhabdus luminescens]
MEREIERKYIDDLMITYFYQDCQLFGETIDEIVTDYLNHQYPITIPVIFQVASLLAALAHPGHIVIYAPGDSLPCRRDAP